MRITRRTGSSLLLTFLIVAALPLFADHAIDWLVSKRKPETTLAGIAIGKPINRVFARYGRPTSVRRDPADETSTYRWNKGDFQIEVSTNREVDPKVETVDQVRISGDRSIPAGRTGAGVRLGDRFDQLVAKYGSRYRTDDRTRGPKAVLTVRFFFSDDSELAAELNDDGEIISLELTASGE